MWKEIVNANWMRDSSAASTPNTVSMQAPCLGEGPC
jgi:hypothetical protein